MNVSRVAALLLLWFGLLFWPGKPASGQTTPTDVVKTSNPLDSLYENFLQRHPNFRFKKLIERAVAKGRFEEVVEKKRSLVDIAKLAETLTSSTTPPNDNPLMVSWMNGEEVELAKIFQDIAEGNVDRVEMQNDYHTRRCQQEVDHLIDWVTQVRVAAVKPFSKLGFLECMDWIKKEKAKRAKRLPQQCEYSCDGDLAKGAKIKCRIHGEIR
ncbi:MAG: hypothetical protein WA705_21155 [Candidatus Ozemobacteraceae bacterium]